MRYTRKSSYHLRACNFFLTFISVDDFALDSESSISPPNTVQGITATGYQTVSALTAIPISPLAATATRHPVVSGLGSGSMSGTDSASASVTPARIRSSQKLPGGAIGGTVAGSLIVCALVLFGAYIICKERTRRLPSSPPEPFLYEPHQPTTERSAIKRPREGMEGSPPALEICQDITAAPTSPRPEQQNLMGNRFDRLERELIALRSALASTLFPPSYEENIDSRVENSLPNT